MSFTNTVWSQCGLGIHPSPFTACGKQPFCRPLMVSGGKKRQARIFFPSLTSYFLSQKQQKKRMKIMRARTFCLCVFFLACGCSRSNESCSSCAIFIFRLSGAKPAQVVSHWGAMQCGPKQPRSEKFSSHFFAIKGFFFDRLKLRDRTFVVCGCGGVPVVSSADLFIGAAEGS